MAFVYWIHLEEHTDVSKQGYVGITTMKDPNLRFLKHKSDMNFEERSCIVHRAMRKYGDKILFTILKECTKEEAVLTEKLLRPHHRIGWNTLAGGDSPRVGYKHTQEAKDKISKTRLSRKYVLDRKAESTEKHKETFKNKHLFDLHNQNQEYWKHCLLLYQLYLDGDSAYVATRRLGLSKGGIVAMWKRFQYGWNPTLDERVLDFVKKNPPTRTIDTSNVTSNVGILGVIKRGDTRYVASKTINGKNHSRSFSINKYGEEESLRLAIEFRQQLDKLENAG